MNPIYLETHFHAADSAHPWPESFAIIIAYATTGESWTAEANQAADLALQQHLLDRGCLPRRVIGYSPQTNHAEPGWTALLSWEEACDLGKQYKQDAIYVVARGLLFVTYCDERRGLVEVGAFGERVTVL